MLQLQRRMIPANIYLLKFNNKNSRKMCEIFWKLTIKTTQRRQWRCSGVFIVNFKHILHLFVMFLLLTLSKQILAEYNVNSSYLAHSSQCNITSPPENSWFSDVVRGYRNAALRRNGSRDGWTFTKIEKVGDLKGDAGWGVSLEEWMI